MLALDVNAGDWLPLDTKSANSTTSPTRRRSRPRCSSRTLNAAAAISRMAVGDRNAPTIDTTYTNPSYLSQHPWDHVEGRRSARAAAWSWSTSSRPTRSTRSR
ncbi:MAG: hypothetical protein R2712_05420 [Vicinamibacterales bacterium]